MAIQDVIRFFLPKEEHFYEFLEKQAKAAVAGAAAIAKFANNGSTADEARTAVQKWEHEGDKIVHEMEEALAKTFVTPIDREDLQKLSSNLDSVLDLTNGAIRACSMLGVSEPTEPMKKLIHLIGECTAKIDEAIPLLRKHKYHEIVEAARALRKLEKQADTVYREAIRDLFATESSADARLLVREKTVLEDLENAIDACDEIADTLTNVALKNG